MVNANFLNRKLGGMAGEPPSEWLSVHDAAAVLKVPHRSLARWVRAGRVRAWLVGPKLIRVRLSDIVQPYAVRGGVAPTGRA